MPDFKYWAFISYSHRDKSWADWLHKSLETFVVPGRLIGRASRDEKVPARLYPIFRDREELPTSGDLGGNIEEALRQSRYLVVICSKASAASRWVDGEIRTFKAQGKADRVLCLIVDGEPNASDKAAGAAEECFAKSLRFKLGPGGALTEEPAEPIAADAREGMDGKENCLLKVAAGLLGVGFDELRQRDAERRRRARALALAGAAAIAGVLLWQERAKIVDLRRQLAQVDYERGKALRESGEGGASAVFFAESNRIRPTVAARANAAHFVRRTAIPQLILPVSAAVVSVALNERGRFGAAGSADGAVRVWDGPDGAELGTIRLHERAVRALAFSPDGKLLVAGSDDGTATLWDVKGRKALATLAHDGPVTAAAFSPDGRRFATADRTAKVWDAAGRPSLKDSPEPSVPGAGPPRSAASPIRALAFAPGGAGPFSGEEGAIALAFSRDGKTLCSIGSDRSISCRDSASGTLKSRVSAAGLTPVALGTGAETVLAVSADGSARVYDSTLTKPLGPVMRHDGGVFAAAFSADGRALADGGGDMTVRLWHARAPAAESSHDLKTGPVASAAFSADGSRVAVLPAGKVFNTRSGALADSTGPSDSVALSADGSVVITSTGEAVYAQNAGSPRRLLADGVPRDFVAVSADGRTAITFQHDDRLKEVRAMTVFDVPAGKKTAERYVAGRTNEVYAAALSPDGKRLLLDYHTQDGNRADVDDAVSGERLSTLGEQEEAVAAVAFSPDGRSVATSGSSGIARLWNARTGKPVGRPLRHGDAVRFTVFSADGGVAATAGDALPARLWDAATGEALGTPLGTPGTRLKALAIDADGIRLLALTDEGLLLSWEIAWATSPLDSEELVDAARLAAAGRLDAQGELEPLSREDQARSLLKWVGGKR